MSPLLRQVWSERALAAFAAGVTLLLVVAGVLAMREQVDAVRRDRHAELEAVTTLKAGAIEAWLRERRDDVQATADDPLLRAALAGPDGPALAQARLALVARTRGVHAAWLVDASAQPLRVIAAADGSRAALPAPVEALVRRAVAAGEPVTGEFWNTAEGLHLDFAAALQRGDGRRGDVVVVLATIAGKALEPLVQSWPTPSPSAESLLVRRDGDDVAVLTHLRSQGASAPTVRRPLAQGIVAARGALGASGVLEGPDYRGVAVMAAVRPVAGTDWFLLAKVDRDELMREVRWRAATILVVTAAGAGAAAGLALLVAGLQRRNAWRRAYDSERARRLALEEYRATLEGIGDGVLSTDGDGLVRRMNPVAEELTGWREADAQGMPVREVFRIVNEDTRAEVESPVERVLREGRIVGLANHTLLIARDGRERPIADSGAPVRDDEGRIVGVVLVFRDQTLEREAQRALRARADEAERFNHAAVDRELRMVELKQEVDALLRRLGEPGRYGYDEGDGGPA